MQYPCSQGVHYVSYGAVLLTQSTTYCLNNYLTRVSIHGCMSTETTSIALQITNISPFLHFLTEDTILVQLQKKIEKGGFQKNTDADGTPSHSDRKSHLY